MDVVMHTEALIKPEKKNTTTKRDYIELFFFIVVPNDRKYHGKIKIGKAIERANPIARTFCNALVWYFCSLFHISFKFHFCKNPLVVFRSFLRKSIINKFLMFGFTLMLLLVFLLLLFERCSVLTVTAIVCLFLKKSVLEWFSPFCIDCLFLFSTKMYKIKFEWAWVGISQIHIYSYCRHIKGVYHTHTKKTSSFEPHSTWKILSKIFFFLNAIQLVCFTVCIHHLFKY